jgi:hypothetical protein
MNRAERDVQQLIDKVKVAVMALFDISDSFALSIELLSRIARLEQREASPDYTNRLRKTCPNPPHHPKYFPGN